MKTAMLALAVAVVIAPLRRFAPPPRTPSSTTCHPHQSRDTNTFRFFPSFSFRHLFSSVGDDHCDGCWIIADEKEAGCRRPYGDMAVDGKESCEAQGGEFVTAVWCPDYYADGARERTALEQAELAAERLGEELAGVRAELAAERAACKEQAAESSPPWQLPVRIIDDILVGFATLFGGPYFVDQGSTIFFQRPSRRARVGPSCSFRLETPKNGALTRINLGN
jgi:hypothetical protein